MRKTVLCVTVSCVRPISECGAAVLSGDRSRIVVIHRTLEVPRASVMQTWGYSSGLLPMDGGAAL